MKLSDEQIDYLFGLDEKDKKLLMVEVKKFIISSAREGEITFPNGMKKTLKREVIGEIWKLVRELEDGQSRAEAWGLAHGYKKIKD